MDTLDVVTKPTTPGFSNDCGVEGCIEGGLCGNLTLRAAAGFGLWCCEPYASFCWAAPQPDCRFDVREFSVGPLILCEVFAEDHYQWCCDGTSEVCAFTDAPYRCLDYRYGNPVRNGLLSAAPISTFSSTTAIPKAVEPMDTAPTLTAQPEPTTQSPPLPLGGAVALGVGGLVLIVAAAVGARYLWKRSARRQSHSPAPVELDADCELTPPHELRGAASLQELHGVTKAQEGTGIHELGSGKAEK